MTLKSLPARSEDQNYTRSVEEIYREYSNMIYWVSFAYMKNKADTEDIVADVFVKLINKKIQFQNSEH